MAPESVETWWEDPIWRATPWTCPRCLWMIYTPEAAPCPVQVLRGDVNSTDDLHERDGGEAAEEDTTSAGREPDARGKLTVWGDYFG